MDRLMNLRKLTPPARYNLAVRGHARRRRRPDLGTERHLEPPGLPADLDAAWQGEQQRWLLGSHGALAAAARPSPPPVLGAAPSPPPKHESPTAAKTHEASRPVREPRSS